MILIDFGAEGAVVNELVRWQTENGTVVVETDDREPEVPGRDEVKRRDLLFEGADRPQAVKAAELYGRMLADLGVLRHGNVREVPRFDPAGLPVEEPMTTIADLFNESRGGIVLLHMNDMHHVIGDLDTSLAMELLNPRREDPVVILRADAEHVLALHKVDSFMARRFLRIGDFDQTRSANQRSRPEADSEPRLGIGPATGGPDGPSSDVGGRETRKPRLPGRVHVSELPAVTGGRIPIGVADGPLEPVFVDFDADPHLLVAGAPASGRANLLRLLIDGIAARRRGGRETEIHVFDQNRILRSLAPEFGRTEPVGPGVGYTDSAEEFAEIVVDVSNRPPEGEVFLIVIDRDPAPDPLWTLRPSLLASPGSRFHLVLASLLTLPGRPLDPLVSTLHELGAPAVLMGYSDGEEPRLYGADPPARDIWVGRAVPARHGRHRVVQVAHTSPEV